MPIANAVITFVALCLNMVRQLRRPDEAYEAQPNPPHHQGDRLVAAFGKPRMRTALEVAADHGRHRLVPPPPRIDWSAYPTATPTEQYISQRIRRQSGMDMIIAGSNGDKRCGIARHRYPPLLRIMVSRAWAWWWARQRTAAAWWWHTQVTARVTGWWARTAPASPWVPVTKALTTQPERQRVAVTWVPRGQTWIPMIVAADQAPIARSPLGVNPGYHQFGGVNIGGVTTNLEVMV